MVSAQTLAAELYDLEIKRPLTSTQMGRWQQLAAQLFRSAVEREQRKSPRVRAETQVLIGVEAIDVIDVSWQGMLVRSATLPEHVTITAIRAAESEAWQQLEIPCRVRQNQRGILLELTEPDPRKRHDFFVHAYYPIYLSHLQNLARA